jgi:replication factor C small subunit
MKVIKSARPEYDHPAAPLPWAEKYRPDSLDQVQGNDHVVESLGRFIKEGAFGHLLFIGPAGVGKTTCAHILAGKVTGQDPYELNASDERGIDTVRDVILEYASTVPLGSPFKVMILDESDAMTVPAQQAFRRTMEKFSGNCKFILIANNEFGLIDPIKDRCTPFYFDPIPKDVIFGTLDGVLQMEKYSMTEDALNIIVDRARGSLRRAINFLQSACEGRDKNFLITSEIVRSILQAPPYERMSEIVVKALEMNFIEAVKLYTDLFHSGPGGAADFVDFITDDLARGADLGNSVPIGQALADVRLGNGRQDYLQVIGFLARLSGLRAS